MIAPAPDGEPGCANLFEVRPPIPTSCLIVALDWAASNLPLPITTRTMAVKAAACLRAAQPTADLDPEMITNGITLAGYHLERDRFSFDELEHVLRQELGLATASDKLSSYIHAWYAGAAGLLALASAECGHRR